VITKIEVRNYQSLKSVDLTLGKFTVIVGPSSSGKSALLRAVRSLVSNSRGGAFVTRGQKAALVTMILGDTLVSYHKQAIGGAVYKIGNLDLADGGPLTEFTKVGSEVPEQITAALKIPQGEAINFAGQFDLPYLLADSGGTVARVLGELTNVTVIFEAARLANKRKLQVVSQLKAVEDNVSRLKVRAQAFAGLTARQAACTTAEEALSRASLLDIKVRQLSEVTTRLEVAQVALGRLESDYPAPPSLEPTEHAQQRLEAFKEYLQMMTTQVQAIKQAMVDEELLVVQEDALHQQLHDVLVAAGVCPTCNQVVGSSVTV
jgi:DNA repair protein SbcC/Rad50